MTAKTVVFFHNISIESKFVFICIRYYCLNFIDPKNYLFIPVPASESEDDGDDDEIRINENPLIVKKEEADDDDEYGVAYPVAKQRRLNST